jgi:class 3 adenylate cyclase
VNLAARLCSHATAGEILIDDTTAERLHNCIVTATARALDLKGYSEAVPAYRVLSVSPVSRAQPQDSDAPEPLQTGDRIS